MLDEVVEVQRSPIHGKGLYAKVIGSDAVLASRVLTDSSQTLIKKDQIIIEYVGELIRPVLCDKREAFYDSKVCRLIDVQVLLEYRSVLFPRASARTCSVSTIGRWLTPQ